MKLTGFSPAVDCVRNRHSLPPYTPLSLLLAQPWFLAPGHPAQSLLHTARALGSARNIGFLLPAKAAAARPGIVAELDTLGTVLGYNGGGHGFAGLTAAAVLRAGALYSRGVFRSVLFCDAHLPVLLALAALGRLHAVPISAVVLQGPERTFRSLIRRQLLMRALRRSDLRLYCRTDELTAAWGAELGVHGHRVATLPSLELPKLEAERPLVHSGALRLGVLGQIRPGKGIERIVGACGDREGIELTVAGPYASASSRRRYRSLLAGMGSAGRVLHERELVQLARRQDYILLLYDRWDDRMESGILYLAAAVGRPIVAYRGGWCARQVERYDCGVLLGADGGLVELEKLPRAGSVRYEQLCDGMRRFARDNSGERVADRFLEVLGIG